MMKFDDVVAIIVTSYLRYDFTKILSDTLERSTVSQ